MTYRDRNPQWKVVFSRQDRRERQRGADCHAAFKRESGFGVARTRNYLMGFK
ncbi:hypothetical protein RMSM_00349 [Rhodopirellula maiorica SM1]|uniref:Uncharacterized protein n=1 Tax=Rhodopirellula maiorica SM1 TaxID=1265738 RepID=M5RTQ4_9BACT|nr:hypothetical protein RMSM_00349 [Rhodopirellula maiorica SM1]